MMKANLFSIYIFTFVLTLLISGCSMKQNVPLPTVPDVDINKFMGDWYVIAAIPTFIETESYNAIESYKLNDDGTVATTFSFNEGSLTGEMKTYRPKGFITEGTGNAIWRMQFIWPFKADYRIVYLDKDYQVTVIGRMARDYVWIMARTPFISEAEYQKIVTFIESIGYDSSKLRKVPHQS